MKPSRYLAAAGACAVLFHAAPSLAGGPSTSTVVTSSVNPVALGQTTTLTATVTSSGPPACAGLVRFNSGGTEVCAATLAGGGPTTFAATCSATGAQLGGLGSRSVSAAYTSSGSCVSSTSAALAVTVTADPAQVPTVGEWSLWGLMGLMMLGGTALLVRRTRRLT